MCYYVIKKKNITYDLPNTLNNKLQNYYRMIYNSYKYRIIIELIIDDETKLYDIKAYYTKFNILKMKCYHN